MKILGRMVRQCRTYQANAKHEENIDSELGLKTLNGHNPPATNINSIVGVVRLGTCFLWDRARHPPFVGAN